MQLIKNYVRQNYSLLFQHYPQNTLTAIFDSKGFKFTDNAQKNYTIIKNQPHIYVAWTNHVNGYYYVGKSFQKGGRWKRQHAYHLGTLAHHLLDTIRYDDQNHAHWIKHWMDINTLSKLDENHFSIILNEEVYISFIPFCIYSANDFNILDRNAIRQINTEMERQLIQSYLGDNKILLNVQHN
jgi:hypothetical protein